MLNSFLLKFLSIFFISNGSSFRVMRASVSSFSKVFICRSVYSSSVAFILLVFVVLLLELYDGFLLGVSFVDTVLLDVVFRFVGVVVMLVVVVTGSRIAFVETVVQLDVVFDVDIFDVVGFVVILDGVDVDDDCVVVVEAIVFLLLLLYLLLLLLLFSMLFLLLLLVLMLVMA